MTHEPSNEFGAPSNGDEYSAPEGEFPGVTRALLAGSERPPVRIGRLVAMLAGIAGFVLWAFMPSMPDAIDPEGQLFVLDKQARLAIGLFVLAAVWWVFEVVPVGITAVTVAVVQVVFQIRDSRTAFTDFMDPAVWFIIGALTIGTAFARTGLTNRIAYRMLSLVGERTKAIYFGSFVMTASLTLVMAQSAVAAAVFPLLAVIYAAYTRDSVPTRFGKGLFVGMAFTAGAGSIITLFGAARGVVAIGLFRDLTGREVDFFELSYYMLPLGVVMVVLLWLYILLIYPPEKGAIPGLKERAEDLRRTRGPLSWHEWLTVSITFAALLAMSARNLIPALSVIDKSAIILGTTILFFLTGCLRLQDLESLPLNIILLFGGAMSIGLCLWQTGAAQWLAVQWLNALPSDSSIGFVIGVSVFVLIMTNLIMNVAAIAISLPVALVMAPYLGVAPDVVLFSALAAAGMPFLTLVGAPPNAIAYQSRQFTGFEFFRAGVPVSIVLVLVIALFVWKIWPWMGMQTVLPN